MLTTLDVCHLQIYGENNKNNQPYELVKFELWRKKIDLEIILEVEIKDIAVENVL